MLGQFVRSAGFWTLDMMKGRPIRKRLNYLNNLYETGTPNTEALDELLRHAISTVPYYKGVSAPNIQNFPVVSKDDYRKDFASFRSSIFLNDQQLHRVYTSGSTGNPFMAYQDREKLMWHRAGLIGINNRIGWNLGDRFMFFRLWGVAHNESRISQIMSNTIPVDVMDFTEQKMEEIRLRLLKDKSLSLLLGYASALEKLAEYLIAKKDGATKYGIRLVIADSENLSERAKELIEEAFRCPVLNRYANNENGILGLTGINQSRFKINFPEYYVEVLKLDEDEAAPQGVLGRIVITDLYNKAFPFIRYDTGDLGIASQMKNGQCYELQELSGRVSTALKDCNGNIIGETALTAFYENVTGIGRYQMAQIKDKEYELRVERTPANLDAQLIEQGKKAFGSDAIVSVVHVDKIPQGKNGKYKITSYEVKK